MAGPFEGMIPRMLRAYFVVLLTLSPLGCGSTRQLSARDEQDARDTGGVNAGVTSDERQLLKMAPSLPDGVSKRVGALEVVASSAYASASGRTCRPLQISERSTRANQRLACTDGRAWFFVPDVFGAPKGN